MFGASKPLASLSSGLLARKGQARPAMRPQGFASLTGIGSPLEDLGWNDMGSVSPHTDPDPAPEAVEEPALLAVVEEPEAEPAPVPPVLAEREALKEAVESESVPALRAERPVSVATATRLARESAQQTRKGKAAFTLRLDGERHLRLRLASALAGRPAQHLVTGAVDELLRAIPEVELLVAQLPQPRKSGQ